VVVVIDRGFGAEHLAQAGLAALAGHDEDLLEVRVLAGLDVDQVREREVAHGRGARVDDLVRELGPPGGQALTSCLRIG
jgi:hypothetical protein